jgi:hypothetical protein
MKRKFIRLATMALLATGISVVASCLTPAPVVWAQSAVLAEAQSLYEAARFDEAVTRLREALSSGEVAGPDALKAKELLGRCLVKAGSRIEAREAFKSLLRQDNGYRLDAVTVPPDEMAVFDEALKDITDEQIEAGQRVPASIGLFFGIGSGANKDYGEFVADGGGDEEFESKAAFGGSVRFPLRPRLSLDIELARFRATNSDTAGAFSSEPVEYEITAIPLIVSLYWTAVPRETWRVNLFGGVGPLMASRVSFKIPGAGNSTLTISDERQGVIFQGGVEGEYLLTKRFSLSGRVAVRSATASGFYEDSQLDLYTSNVFLDDRDVNFSGFSANVALRAYIGY